MNRRTNAFVALLLAGSSAACQIPATGVAPKSERAEPLVWPAPPLPARIRFVKSVARPQDMGIQPSFWRRVVDVIAGREEQWLIRPTGVAAHDQIIFVADPGAQALWILDGKTGSFHKLQEANGQRLVSPVAVASGGGLIYLADSYLAKIFVFDEKQNLLRAIGHPDLRRPAGIAYDAARDRLFVADSAAHEVRVFSKEGKALAVIGARGSGDGEFNFPTHVALDGAGDLYVTDALNFRVQIFHADGSFAGQFGRHGDTSGDFAAPKGVTVDSAGHVYVADALFDAVQIFDRKGRYLLTFGERGVESGSFWLPGGVFIDSRDLIYVADAYNQRLQIFEYLPGNDDE